MKKYTVSELEGYRLDMAVARAEGLTICESGGSIWAKDESGDHMGYITSDSMPAYSPSKLWQQGGPIIDRDHIFLQPPCREHHHGGSTPGWNRYDYWRATVSANTRVWFKPEDREPGAFLSDKGRVGRGCGSTPLVAAMRAYVTSKFGEEVELP